MTNKGLFYVTDLSLLGPKLSRNPLTANGAKSVVDGTTGHGRFAALFTTQNKFYQSKQGVFNLGCVLPTNIVFTSD